MRYLILLFIWQQFILSVSSLTPDQLIYHFAKADANHRTSRGKSYRHRRSDEVDVDSLMRSYGMTSGSMRRRAPVRNLVSEEEILSFLGDWLPTRSTVAPVTTVAKQQKWKLYSKSKKYQKKRKQKKNDKIMNFLHRITIKRQEDFTPRDDRAVKALVTILKREARAMRKKILKQKITETKREIKRLQSFKVVKPRKSFSSESQEFADWLGRSIEDQEVERLNDHRVVKPFAKIRSSGTTYISKVRSLTMRQTGRHIRSNQTEVTSSLVFANTPSPLSISYHVRDGQVRKWTKGSPSEAPTVTPLLVRALGTKIVDDDTKKGTKLMEPLFSVIDIPGNDIMDRTNNPPPYPFSHCYVNKDGLTCCNRLLESLMRKSYYKVRRATRSATADLQQVAQRIQQDCEQVFNTTFETIVSYEDYTLRAHFAGDLMCKIDKDGRYITVYATSMPNRRGVKQDPLTIITSIALNAANINQDHVLQSRSRRTKDSQSIPYHELSREDVGVNFERH